MERFGGYLYIFNSILYNVDYCSVRRLGPFMQYAVQMQ